jgi:hypothetical protein
MPRDSRQRDYIAKVGNVGSVGRAPGTAIRASSLAKALIFDNQCDSNLPAEGRCLTSISMGDMESEIHFQFSPQPIKRLIVVE